MIALSLTAIGLRPLRECLAIVDEVGVALAVDAIELAIGVECPVDADYGERRLVLHDSCLWTADGRRRLDPLQPRTWDTYRRFVDTHRVVSVGVHAPHRSRCTAPQLRDALRSLQDALGVPVAVEVMPEPQRWCSSIDTLVDHPILLDVSHVLIWARGDERTAQAMCGQLMDRQEVREFHLSHNDGRRDSHDLIPAGVWFEPLIEQWAEGAVVTYESLPAGMGAHERLDTRRSRWARRLAEPTR